MAKILRVHYEMMKDQTKEMKHCIVVKLTDTKKKKSLNAVAELPEGSVLLNEFTEMIRNLEEQDEASEKARKEKKKSEVSSPEKAVV